MCNQNSTSLLLIGTLPINRPGNFRKILRKIVNIHVRYCYKRKLATLVHSMKSYSGLSAGTIMKKKTSYRYIYIVLYCIIEECGISHDRRGTLVLCSIKTFQSKTRLISIKLCNYFRCNVHCKLSIIRTSTGEQKRTQATSQ